MYDSGSSALIPFVLSDRLFSKQDLILASDNSMFGPQLRPNVGTYGNTNMEIKNIW